MKMNFTLYHLTDLVDNFKKSKRSTNKIFKDLSSALGVPLSSLEALKEARNQKPPQIVAKEHSWSVELNQEVIYQLDKLDVLSKSDFIQNISGKFLNDLSALRDVHHIFSFDDKVLEYAKETNFEGVRFDLVVSVLKRKMQEVKYFDELNVISSLLQKGTQEQINNFFDNSDFISKIENKYLWESSNYPEFFETLNKNSSYVEKRVNPLKARVLLGDKVAQAYNREEDKYMFVTSGITNLFSDPEKKEYWKDFEFIHYVDDVVAHKSIQSITFKFNRKLSEDEERKFPDILNHLILSFNMTGEEFKNAISAAALNLKLENAMNRTEKQQNNIVEQDFKL